MAYARTPIRDRIRRLRPGFVPTVGLLIGLAPAISGCAIERSAWKQHYLAREQTKPWSLTLSTSWSNSDAEGEPLVLEQEDFSKHIVGCYEGEWVTVSYPESLAEHAEAAARMLDAAFARTQAEIGQSWPYHVDLHLIAVEQSPRLFRSRWRIKTDEPIPVPVLVIGSPSNATGLWTSNDAAWLYGIAHELAEFALMDPGHRPTALPDAQVQLLGPVKFTSTNRTRWFRDGFANYASYVLFESVRQEAGDDWPHDMGSVGHERPFSSLDRVGRSLFQWTQYDPQDWSDAYYNAALGLFLLIEAEHGRERIRQIMQHVAEVDYPDGAALLQAANDVLGIDLRERAHRFGFPSFGLALTSFRSEEASLGVFVDSVAAGQPGATAGFLGNDIIQQINGRVIHNMLDYELAVFEMLSGEDTSMEVVVARRPDNGQGERQAILLTLPLPERDDQLIHQETAASAAATESRSP